MFDGLIVGLIIPYSSDPNVAVQSIFKDTESLDLSTALENKQCKLKFEVRCGDKAHEVSTYYSMLENQSFEINSYSEAIRDDSIRYKISLSGNSLEVASRQFNDFDPQSTKDYRGDFDPVYPLEIDSMNIEFKLAQ